MLLVRLWQECQEAVGGCFWMSDSFTNQYKLNAYQVQHWHTQKKLFYLFGMRFWLTVIGSPSHRDKLNIYQVECYETSKHNVLRLCGRFSLNTRTDISFHSCKMVLPSTSLPVLHAMDIKLSVMGKIHTWIQCIRYQCLLWYNKYSVTESFIFLWQGQVGQSILK